MLICSQQRRERVDAGVIFTAFIILVVRISMLTDQMTGQENY